MDPTVDTANSIINYCFTGYFFFEMAAKQVGLGLRRYFADKMNIFDTFVVLASIVEMVVDLAPGESGALRAAPLSFLPPRA